MWILSLLDNFKSIGKIRIDVVCQVYETMGTHTVLINVEIGKSQLRGQFDFTE